MDCQILGRTDGDDNHCSLFYLLPNSVDFVKALRHGGSRSLDGISKAPATDDECLLTAASRPRLFFAGHAFLPDEVEIL